MGSPARQSTTFLAVPSLREPTTSDDAIRCLSCRRLRGYVLENLVVTSVGRVEEGIRICKILRWLFTAQEGPERSAARAKTHPTLLIDQRRQGVAGRTLTILGGQALLGTSRRLWGKHARGNGGVNYSPGEGVAGLEARELVPLDPPGLRLFIAPHESKLVPGYKANVVVRWLALRCRNSLSARMPEIE